MDVVTVVRSGGFAGIRREGRLDLDPGSADPAVAEARALVASLGPADLRPGRPHPDGFVHTFTLPGRPPVAVPEQHLTAALRRLAELVLGAPDR